MPFKYKQAIIIRKDLDMSAGKAVVQGAHVSVLAALQVFKERRDLYDNWNKEGHAKIVLRVNSYEELSELFHHAMSLFYTVALIHDMGLTEVEPGVITAIAIGPDKVENIDNVIKGLKLY